MYNQTTTQQCTFSCAVLLLFLASPVFTEAQSIKTVVEKSANYYEALYKKPHANPELSGMEKETSDAMFNELLALKKETEQRGISIEITRGVGHGYGIVAVIKNSFATDKKYNIGKGNKTVDTKVIMLLTYIDALPIREETGLHFASTKVVDANGLPVANGTSGTSLMHTC